MKNLLRSTLCLLVLSVTCASAWAQESKLSKTKPLYNLSQMDEMNRKQLTIKKNSIYRLDEKVKHSRAKIMLGEYPDALREYKRGRTKKAVGYVIGVPFLVLTSLSTVAFFNENNHSEDFIYLGIGTAIGVGGVLLGALIGTTAKKNYRAAIDIYNKGLYKDLRSVNINFGFTSNGVGLSMRF